METEPTPIAVRRVERSGVVDEQAGTTLGLDITLQNGEAKRLVLPLAAAVDAAIALLVSHQLALKLRTEKGLQNSIGIGQIAIDGAEGLVIGEQVILSLRLKGGGALTLALPPGFAREIGQHLIDCADGATENPPQRH